MVLLLYGPKESPQAGSKLHRCRLHGRGLPVFEMRRARPSPSHRRWPTTPTTPVSGLPSPVPALRARAAGRHGSEIDAIGFANAVRIDDRHQAIHKAVSLYSDAIANHFARDGSGVGHRPLDGCSAREVHKYCRPQSKVEAGQKQCSGILMTKKAATRLLKAPGLFDEDNASAEIYLYGFDFHNQLKARLLEHKAAVQVMRETARAEEFVLDNGMPGRGLQDPATLAWNLLTTCSSRPAASRPAFSRLRDPASAMSASCSRRTYRRPSRAMRAAALRCSSTPATALCFAARWALAHLDYDDFHLPKEKAKSLMAMVETRIARTMAAKL